MKTVFARCCPSSSIRKLKTRLPHAKRPAIFPLRDAIVFFDFDNTLTSFDVLDDIIEKFAESNDWKLLEGAWQKGEIGSKACLAGQMSCVRVRREKMRHYLSSIKMDPGFKKIYSLLKKYRVPALIVSDSFRFFIDTILKNHGFRDIQIVSNQLKFTSDRLDLHFPHLNKRHPLCANCKKDRVLRAHKTGKKIIYVGDGLSDLCPSLEADLVFAKGTLAKKLELLGRPFVPFDSLKKVYLYFLALKEK